MFIIEPVSGTTVSSPVTIKFGVSGISIVPAGTMQDNSGHHHLIVDAPLPGAGQPIPKDENNVHFGKGQTETSLELAPGQHTLQLMLGDTNHIPHENAVVSEQISITVQ